MAQSIQDGWSYTDCGLPTDPFQLESLEVTPDPPKPGQNLTVKATFTVTDTIEQGAYADVTVKLGLIKILHKQFDVDEVLQKATPPRRLPLQAGRYTEVFEVDLPREIPRAKFTINVRAYTIDDEDLACLDAKVDFMSRPHRL